MRILRVFGYLLLLVLIGAAGVAWYAFRNETRLVNYALAAIYQRTGLNITAPHSRLFFRNHLIIRLDRPHLTMNGHEVAQLADIRAVVSYHALLYSNGLPLYELILDRANLRLPLDLEHVADNGPLKPDIQLVKRFKGWLDAVSDIIQRVELIDSLLADSNGSPLAQHIDLIAFREHRRVRNSSWLLNFDAQSQRSPVDGMLVSGRMRMGAHPTERDFVSAGKLWFWGLDLNGASVGGVSVKGQMQGGVRLILHESGMLSGSADIELRQLALGGKALTRVVTLGDYSLHGSYVATPARVDLTGLELLQGRSEVFQAHASVLQPLNEIRSVIFDAGGVKLALPKLAIWLRSLRRAPSDLVTLMGRIRSGDFTLSQVSLDTTAPLHTWTLSTLRDNLRAEMTLANLTYTPPPDSKIPPVDRLSAEIAYGGGKLSITQGSGTIGTSEVTDASVVADLHEAPHNISYQTKIRGQADAAELFGLAQNAIDQALPRVKGRIEWIRGRAAVEGSASGSITDGDLKVPHEYAVRIEPNGVEFLAARAPTAIAFKSGEVTVHPGTVEISRVVASPNDSPSASLILDGTVEIEADAISFDKFNLDLHGIQAAQWLPLALSPDQLAATGPVGGHLVADGTVGRGMQPTVTGKLTLGPGSLSLGFLRSPMELQSATLTFDNNSLLLDLPAARLEGEPLDFRLAVPDFAHPTMVIDAKAAKLDFQVMRFIRLPWAPATPPRFFPLPVSGHIEAAAANFDKLKMTKVATDFFHNDKEWAAQNFTARTFEGRVDLDISGRAEDNWIHIKGHLLGMNAARIFALTGNTSHAPLDGTLYATGDLWGNTDVDFFNTLAGSASVDVVDGTLNKFTLLTRVLSLIDLKNWVTANVPDPRAVGIPFKKLTANFKGERGDFYTDNLLVDGPVMDIRATGDIRFNDNTMDMQISLIPFNTANWIVKQIPIVGKQIASGSKGLVAAYFHVTGPVSDPKVVPKPITSVAKFVIKTLSLPINILAPDTIK